MDPTNKTLDTTLGDKPVTLYFNANMQLKFEERTNRMFMDWFVDLHSRMMRLYSDVAERARREVEESSRGKEKLTKEKLEQLLKVTELDALVILRMVSMKDFTALVWAACHTYDHRDEPVWEYSHGAIGKMLDHGEMVRMFPDIMKILFHNFTPGRAPEKPKPAEDEEQRSAEVPTNPTPATKPRGGGKTFGASESVVLGSLRKRSAK